MKPSWFKARGYRHFDVPVGNAFLDTIEDPKVVQTHGWTPLISFVKETKRYRRAEHKTKLKPRTIMYASHRDASIFARYASVLNEALDRRYVAEGWTRSSLPTGSSRSRTTISRPRRRRSLGSRRRA